MRWTSAGPRPTRRPSRSSSSAPLAAPARNHKQKGPADLSAGPFRCSADDPRPIASVLPRDRAGPPFRYGTTATISTVVDNPAPLMARDCDAVVLAPTVQTMVAIPLALVTAVPEEPAGSGAAAAPAHPMAFRDSAPPAGSAGRPGPAAVRAGHPVSPVLRGPTDSHSPSATSCATPAAARSP